MSAGQNKTSENEADIFYYRQIRYATTVHQMNCRLIDHQKINQLPVSEMFLTPPWDYLIFGNHCNDIICTTDLTKEKIWVLRK